MEGSGFSFMFLFLVFLAALFNDMEGGLIGHGLTDGFGEEALGRAVLGLAHVHDHGGDGLAVAVFLREIVCVDEVREELIKARGAFRKAGGE